MSKPLKKFLPACLVWVWATNLLLAGAGVTITTTHSVPAWGILGAIQIDIDTTYQKGPFNYRFTYPDGRVDSVSGFRGNSLIFEGLPTGRYHLFMSNCCNCSLENWTDVLACRQYVSGETSTLWAKMTTPAATDSSAILLACTDIETDSNAVCAATFWLYAPSDIPADRMHPMLEKAIEYLRKIKSDDDLELEGMGMDAWIAEPFKVLFRFDENGEIRWVYSDW